MSAVLRGMAMVEVGAPPRLVERPLPTPGPGEVLVEVAGCGLCHTDLGFLYEGVRTRHPLPLILGHEISGVVVAAGGGAESWQGRAVVVPAVIPCGECEDCRAGAPMICRRQVMPGNDRDGGFASHVLVPALGLCPVPGCAGDPDAPLGRAGLNLRQLAVIADAVSTPYQALRRAGLRAGQLVVIIGLGGVGGYAAQLALALGAEVVGLDIDPRKAERLPGLGLFLDPRDRAPRELKAEIAAFARAAGLPATRSLILECSGSAAGQALAWELLGHGSTLAVVGFTMAKVELRLSNLMALDARAIGNWGCDPALYPELLQLVLDGGVELAANVELCPLHALPEAMALVRAHEATRRFVLVPQ